MSRLLDKIRAQERPFGTVDIFGEVFAVVEISQGDRLRMLQECVSEAKTTVNPDLKTSLLNRVEAISELQKFIDVLGINSSLTPEQIEQTYQVRVENQYDLQIVKTAIFNFGKYQGVEVLREIENNKPSGKLYGSPAERVELLDYFGSQPEQLEKVTSALNSVQKKAQPKPKRKPKPKSNT